MISGDHGHVKSLYGIMDGINFSCTSNCAFWNEIHLKIDGSHNPTENIFEGFLAVRMALLKTFWKGF